MATDKTDKQTPDSNSGKKSADGMSMKERLLAQRKAEAEGPAKPASAPPVPAARPATRPAAAPTPIVAKSAAAAVEPPVRRPVKLAGAREEERSERGGKKPVSEDVRREIEMLRKSQDKWITYGWMIAVGLLLIAGVTYYITSGKKRLADETERIRVENIERWILELNALDPTKPADQEKLDSMLKDPANDPLWRTTTKGSNELTLRKKSKFAQVKEEINTKEGLIKGIDDLEKIATEAATKPSEELAKARRRLTQYEGGQAGELGVEQTQRVTVAGDKIDRAYIAKLHEEAKALAVKGPGEMKNALAAYTKAEDEVIKLLDDAVKKKVEDRKIYYMGHYRDMITECDALVAIAFTPEVIEKTTWIDLLVSPQKENWLQAGFNGWQIKDGALQAFNDLGSKATAVMSIGDREQWRDYVLEMEFVVTKGDPVLHARIGKNPNNTTINYSIGTSGQNAFKPGATNTITVTVIGSTAKIAYSDTDHTAGEESLSAFMARKGGIGLSVPAGAEIKVMKMRIKPLR